MAAAVGEIPYEPGINGAEGEFAGPGAGLRAGHMIQYPLQFCRGEIGIHHEAGLAADGRRQTARLEPVARRGGAAVLPDDGVADGFAGGAVPHHGGLALVGDADGGDVFGGEAGLAQRLPGNVQLRGPDFPRIVFHPARTGKNLAKLPLRRRHDAATVVKYDGA